ncbi:hypothetical protein Tco_0117647 [Tanacetum coccineum]
MRNVVPAPRTDPSKQGTDPADGGSVGRTIQMFGTTFEFQSLNRSMNSYKYLVGQSMQRSPLFEKVVPLEEQSDDRKKKLAKHNEAKMVLYNALPKKEYERILMCKTAKDIWQSLLITHQGNIQVKDNKIDLLVQQYAQFTILEEESIDSGFARFNTIITSLKALYEGFSSKNYVRTFLRALHPKWRAKVTAIEESKDLSSPALDELIDNLKVHEVVMEKDSKIYKGKKERIKSIALKAKKESSDDETSTSRSDDEKYAMAKGKSDRKFFRCGDPNHLIGDCPKPSRKKDQKAFIGGSWSDSENDAKDKTNEETYLMAQSSNEVTLNSSYYSDNASSLDNDKSLNVTFDESPPPTKLSPLVDDDVGEEEAIKKNTKIVNTNNEEDESIEVDEIINIKESKNHPLDQVIGNLNQRTLRSQAQNHSNFFCFISTIEPKNVNEALKDESWVVRFRRYINRKRENQKWLNKALDEGPYRFQMFVPSDLTVLKLQTTEDLQGDALLHYDAEMELMNLILLSIPNENYNSVDACTIAKEMWKRVERLMRGTIQNQVDRETRFINEFDQFVVEPEEALVSVYNCFAQLMNDLEGNKIIFPIVTQFEKLANASRAKKLEKSHDPLALVAPTSSSFKNTSSYYVTHPTSVVEYDDEYQQDDV